MPLFRSPALSHHARPNRLALLLVLALGLSVIALLGPSSVRADQHVVLEEDFDDIVDGELPDGWTVAEGDWHVVDGELVGTSESSGQLSRITFGPALDHYRVEASVRFESRINAARWTGIVLDIIDPQEEARLAVLGCHKLLEPVKEKGINVPAIFLSGLPGDEPEIKAFQIGAALGPQVGGQVLALLVGHGAEGDLHVADAAELHDRRADVALDAVLQRAAGDGQLHPDADDVVLDDDLLDHAELGDGLVDLRVLDRCKDLEDLLLRGHAGPFTSGGDGDRWYRR
jgi:hypothetical protein